MVLAGWQSPALTISMIAAGTCQSRDEFRNVVRTDYSRNFFAS